MIVSAILVAASVSGYLWQRSLASVGDGGVMIIFYFWALLTFLLTLPSVLITLGIWLGRKNRESPADNSIHL